MSISLSQLDERKTPSDIKSGESELRHLLAMADEIVIHMPDTAKRFAKWREKLHTLVGKPFLETALGEARLDRLSMDLRAIWLGIAHGYSDPHLKSPFRGNTRRFPLGVTNKCEYERVIYPNNLDQRCKKYRPTPSGWQSRHIIFRSGMAAITSLLQNVLPYLFADDQEPVMLDFFGGYFETKLLFDLFSSPLFSFRRHASQNEMLHGIENGNSQLLFMEPVSYDWEMEALDLDKLYAALTLRKRLPRMIIVDTTIIGHTFPLDQFLSALPGDPPPIVMQLTSCLKLDQEGLELANTGIASLFWRKNDTKHGKAALTLARKMRQNRKITGTGLSVDEMAILDVPWFLNPDRFQAHSQSVFENNRQLATVLAPVIASADGIFSHAAHPSLAVSARFPWAVAPFVIFHLREELDNKDAHTRLTSLILKESRVNHLGFGVGMSFGFRRHRFEIIKPNKVLHPNGRAKGVLKVAMGCRQGPTRDAIINLLAAIAQCSEIPDAITNHAGV